MSNLLPASRHHHGVTPLISTNSIQFNLPGPQPTLPHRLAGDDDHSAVDKRCRHLATDFLTDRLSVLPRYGRSLHNNDGTDFTVDSTVRPRPQRRLAVICRVNYKSTPPSALAQLRLQSSDRLPATPRTGFP